MAASAGQSEGSGGESRSLSRVPLGPSGIQVSPLGLGTWAWGDRFFWGYGRTYQDGDLEGAFRRAVEAGITFFDTAEVYGWGRSERLLQAFGRKYEVLDDLVIATKFFPYPWRLTSGSLHRALAASLRRLGRDAVDLYYLHWPFPPRSVETWYRAMVPLLRQGKIRAAGASNVNLAQVKRIQAVLEEAGYPLAAVQVEFNLVRREIEFNGFLEYCREQGIAVVAYSPLASGMLTGKYTPENPPRDWRRRAYPRAFLERLQRLIRLMNEIGQDYGGRTPAQIALNWVMAKGAIPIPGAKNERQAQSNLGALGWSLSPEAVDALDRASEALQLGALTLSPFPRRA